ncbi:MAG: tRNA 2-thiouridine(34) synthase MnmA [Actinomycetia bacterium]|nr:tRNA 2-thiouridine(34) synthase MnmA [Actinomycetes bacterium]
MVHRVVVAMSGGVDSSVAAAVLKEAGSEVVGIGLKLVDSNKTTGAANSCCGIDAMGDARRVAEKLDIPFYVLDFKDVFRTTVIEYFISSYLNGETPNPCIPCNEVIKFEELLRVAKGIRAEYLATGHYARVSREGTGRYLLRKGTDDSKDQSYFLYSLSQEQLSQTLFPVGEMSKRETRELAARLGLRVHDKPESQDICFVEDGDYSSYISKHAGSRIRPGPILDESGAVIGSHRGLSHYTIGQRRGLGVSSSEPMYVVDIDAHANSITVAAAGRLRRQKRILLERMNYVAVAKPEEPIGALARTRYRKPEVNATLSPLDGDRAFVEFHSPREPTAPGQSVVLYNGDAVIGGGVVRRTTDDQ